ncbi:MAG: siderophore-interacting protein [Pseudomonadota bacterium]
MANLKKAVRKVAGRPGPRLLTVKEAFHLTPNMIRVVFAGPELEGLPAGCDGGHCKIMLPEPGEEIEAFAQRLAEGPTPVRRTYTVRWYNAETQEMAIDFVAHGDNGPASRWAAQATEGSFLGFAGPGAPKLTEFDADWYLFAADLSAMPMALAALEIMPKDAKGIAIFEVTSEEDRQEIDKPDGVEVHWLIHPDSHVSSTAQEEFIRGMEWPEGRVRTCIAGEQAVIRALRDFLHNEKQLPRGDVYVSGYWKIGLVEDEHQKMKRLDA